MNADGSKTEAEEVHIEWIKIGDIELKTLRPL